MIRLSSLGDVVLASAALSVESLPVKVDWVVAREYAELLRGHPRIGRLWEYDRRTKLRGWLALLKEIQAQDYTDIVDLHSTLRTKIARWMLARPGVLWRTFPKSRIRLYGYFLFKRLWPKAWRPEPVVVRSARAGGGIGHERPDLRHLLKDPMGRVSRDSRVADGPYFCVMPSSLWPAKQWPVERFSALLKEGSGGPIPVVLGAKGEVSSTELEKRLKAEGIPYVSGTGRWDLRGVAKVLAGSVGYFGNDTGLAHLAESVGVPARVVFGPTVPDMGFGPWRNESQGKEASLWCRPCGKDGRYCIRPMRRYHCMNSLRLDTGDLPQ